MKVFVDSSAWLALEIKNDQNHQQAKARVKKLINQRVLFFTNDYVLSETYTRLIYDIHLTAARDFHQKISQGSNQTLSLLEVSPSERELAWQELEKYADHRLSFTDATIIVHFRRYHLDQIFTFDTHFEKIHLPTNL